MYQIFICLYTVGVFIVSLFKEKARKMWRGEREAFKILKQKVDPAARYLWFHASSLGEFEQGRPIMECLKKEHPEYKILLTFFSPSGYEVRKNYEGADIICYLPLDTYFWARKFLNMVNIEMAFFIKYEFWWNYLRLLHRRDIPVYSVSSIFRPKQIFFRWYGHEYRKVLRCFTRFFVQNEVSRQLLASLGIVNVDITGDTRFDRVIQIKNQAKKLPVVEAFKQDGNVFIAGSSWLPDEEIFIRYFNEHKEWKLIIAPHLIGNDRIQQILSLLQCDALRYTEATEENVKDVRCLIINCFGLLSSIYGYGDVTYIGGGFGVGIHNVLEAAVWGVPVIFGPNNQRFQEARDLLASGGGHQIDSYEDFERLMNNYCADDNLRKADGKKSADYVNSKAGATNRILSAVKLR
ncbi:MAG: 3-deoxy-D-manno-octulosonic acid transferase [Prevotella sp.]|nr:3-deoxy-D-manno-octulosonic acid transferase [Prevotella sp.]